MQEMPVRSADRFKNVCMPERGPGKEARANKGKHFGHKDDLCFQDNVNSKKSQHFHFIWPVSQLKKTR